jgi:hypothetical protein
MTSEMTAAKMALLMKLANKEASRRQRHQVSSAPSRREEDGIDAARPSSVTIEDVEAIEEETRQLEVMLRDERASNDVEWEKVRQVSLIDRAKMVCTILIGSYIRNWHH